MEIVSKATTLKDDFIIQNIKNVVTKNNNIEGKFTTIFNIKNKLNETTFLKNYGLPQTSIIFFKDDLKKNDYNNNYNFDINESYEPDLYLNEKKSRKGKKKGYYDEDYHNFK